MAELLIEATRASDIVARQGGDEFAIVLPGTPVAEAEDFARRIGDALARAFADSPTPLTVSFGVGAFPRDGDTPDALLHIADRELYASKRSSRVGDRNQPTAAAAEA